MFRQVLTVSIVLLQLTAAVNAQSVAPFGEPGAVKLVQQLPPSQGANQILWRSAATKKSVLRRARGTLEINSVGVRFQERNGGKDEWTYAEIETLDLTPRSFVLQSYQSRILRQPGTRRFHFGLAQPMPANVAAELALRVGKPVRNADPSPNVPSFAVVPAHHRLNFGGTNGVLRFTDSGIQYITSGADARNWRWTDINTVSSPDEYHLLVFGYLDSYCFDLKLPITRALLNKLTDAVFAHNPLDRGTTYEDSHE